jgi:cytochrome o ubiquinol oxidase subunit 2
MKNKFKPWLVVISVIVLSLIAAYSLRNYNFGIFNPQGVISIKERNLIYETLALSLVVVVPVFALTFFITHKYRATNTKAKYSPDWDHNRLIETVWWGIPTILIVILSVMTWNSSHTLDPYKPLSSSIKPITIQVVALQWKWLFIYPEQNIATVNSVEIPVNTPINFQITSDAPMNSFWIPQLGGQIYAMPGMSTELHLMAMKTGEYRGLSANLSGDGFSGMTFMTNVESSSNFNTWTKVSSYSKLKLDQSTYDNLTKPSKNNLAMTYTANDNGLYDRVVAKYMSNNFQVMNSMGAN